MTRSHISVMVSGGNLEENQMMVDMLHSFMVEKGFTHVNSSRRMETSFATGPTIADQIRAYNPELFDTPVYLGGETDEEIAMQENSVLMDMIPQYITPHMPVHIPTSISTSAYN